MTGEAGVHSRRRLVNVVLLAPRSGRRRRGGNAFKAGLAATGLGFPSGHAAVAAAIMTVAAAYLTRPARIAGWLVVGLVAAARVYVGAHLPLDAAGGLFLGWAVGSIINLLLGTPISPPSTGAQDASR